MKTVFSLSMFLLLLLTSCAHEKKVSSPTTQKAEGALKLVRICKSDVGTRWELYNKTGLFRAAPTEIRFFSKNDEAPRVTRVIPNDAKATEEFKNGREILESLRAQGNVICEGPERFKTADISELKSELVNYAGSACKEDSYVQSIQSKIKKWQIPPVGTHKLNEINASDQINEATKDFFTSAKAPHDKNSCPRIVEKAIRALLSLPLK